MNTGHIIQLLVLIVNLDAVSLLSDCVYQVCSCDDNFVFCGMLGLTSMPQLMPEGGVLITNAVFDNNQITTIPAGSLPARLSELTFIDNPIRSIDNDAFNESTDTLQSVGFSLAPHSRIPDAFLKVTSLTSFELIDTIVGDWNDNVMKHLGPNIQTLTLGNVSLPTWPDWIQYFDQVTQLTIDNCFLTSIPDNGLDAMANGLISLSLTGNNLTAVPKAISKLVNLGQLYVDGNNITDVTWLPKAYKLDTLALNNNRISNATQLSEALKPYADDLDDLSLISNQLTAIPDFDFLTVNSIDLSFNKISDLNSGSISPSLMGLNLGYNLLVSFPRVVFSSKTLRSVWLNSNLIRNIQASEIPSSLHFLDLQYNQLTEITNTCFPENCSLEYLYLNYNPIISISDGVFQNLANLEQLYLSGTRLTRLPLGMSSLHNIATLDLSDITQLVCTCAEKDLRQMITSMTPEAVTGTCGLLSVYDFFYILSQSCPD